MSYLPRNNRQNKTALVSRPDHQVEDVCGNQGLQGEAVTHVSTIHAVDTEEAIIDLESPVQEGPFGDGWNVDGSGQKRIKVVVPAPGEVDTKAIASMLLLLLLPELCHVQLQVFRVPFGQVRVDGRVPAVAVASSATWIEHHNQKSRQNVAGE